MPQTSTFIYMPVTFSPSMTWELAERIAGDIVLSDQPGMAIRRWREHFGITQRELTRHMGVAPSVLSDYEGGRRSSPGVKMIRRIVEALIEIDQQRGGEVIRRFGVWDVHEAIPDRRDFSIGVDAPRFLEVIDARVMACERKLRRILWGYTLIDSIKAITTLTSSDYRLVYGFTSERALIFLGVKYGRSPMVAIRTHPLKPALVIFHRPENVDRLAIELAEAEGIPLACTDLEYDDLLKRLRSFR